MGGAMAAIEAGFIQGEINDAAYAYQRSVEQNEAIVVGVNKFENGSEDAAPRDLLRVDPAVEQSQRDKLAALRAGRDNARGQRAVGTSGDGGEGVGEPDAAVHYVRGK